MESDDVPHPVPPAVAGMYVVGVSEADTMTVTIDDVWCTEAGGELFNGLTRMRLVRQDGTKVYFSQRVEIVERFIGMLLEGGLVPADMTPVRAPRSHPLPWDRGDGVETG